MILDLCMEPGLIEVLLIVKNVIAVFQIGIPIVGIIMLSWGIAKVVMAGDENKMKEQIRKLPPKIMALVLVFLVPFLVNFTTNLVSDFGGTNYIACYDNVTEESLKEAYALKAESYIAEVKAKLSRSSYNTAESFIKSIKDKDIRNQYLTLLKPLETQLHIISPGSGGGHGETNNLPPPSTNLVEYSQLSSGKYGNTTVCPSRSSKTIEESGCGIVALAMVTSNLGNSNYDVENVRNFLCTNIPSSIASNGALADSAFSNSQLLNHYKLQSKVLFSGINISKDTAMPQDQASQIVSALKQGNMIVLHIPGHYVSLLSINNSNKIYLVNPANVSNASSLGGPGFGLPTGNYTIEQIWSKLNTGIGYKKRCETENSCSWKGAYSFSKA